MEIEVEEAEETPGKLPKKIKMKLKKKDNSEVSLDLTENTNVHVPGGVKISFTDGTQPHLPRRTNVGTNPTYLDVQR